MSAVVGLSASPILQFFDNNGRPNVGGTLLTQVGGVNYPTYQDAAGATALPNPIPLNSRGEVSNSSGVSCQLFLVDGVAYTFTLYDAAGNQLNQATSVEAFGGGVAVSYVTNISALKALSGMAAGAIVQTQGYYTAGDGGAGTYWWNSTDTRADNGTTIIAPNAGGTGRWNLIIGIDAQTQNAYSSVYYSGMQQGHVLPFLDENALWTGQYNRFIGEYVDPRTNAGYMLFEIGSHSRLTTDDGLFGNQVITTSSKTTGATTLDLSSVTGILNGATLGIMLDNDTAFYTYVNGAPSGNTVTLGAALPSACSSGNTVVATRATTLAVAAAATNTSVTVVNALTVTTAMTIRIGLDNGSVFSSSISAVNTGTGVITLGSAMPSSAAIGSFVTFDSYDADPTIILSRSTGVGQANDDLGLLAFAGCNDDAVGTAANVNFAQLYAQVVSAAHGAEYASFNFEPMVNGSLHRSLTIAQGLFTAGATGGDKGVDTINVSQVYKNGVATPLVQAGSFTWDNTTTGTQSITGVSFTPRCVLIFAEQGAGGMICWGWDDGVTPRTAFLNNGGTTTTPGQSGGASALLFTSAGNFAQFKITSFDSGGFTITKSLAGSPTGTATVNYIALG